MTLVALTLAAVTAAVLGIVVLGLVSQSDLGPPPPAGPAPAAGRLAIASGPALRARMVVGSHRRPRALGWSGGAW